jgi:hypothetical protein
MLLSRFWYVFAGLAVGVLVFLLFLAQSVYNRAVGRSLQEGLVGDSQVVSWYLKNDARERASQLIKFATNSDLGRGLAEASRVEGPIPDKTRDTVKSALNKVASTIAKAEGFDALFAIDQQGRVVANVGYEAMNSPDSEMGGYSVVADALHGYIRDDTLLLDRLYRVVARPVEYDLGQLPSGAIVGARVLDEQFARNLSERTGAALAFFVNGNRVSAAATGTFNKILLDQLSTEISSFKQDEQFKKLGMSSVQLVRGTGLAVIYGRIPGETWQLDVGYAVAREASEISSVMQFFSRADDKDKSAVPLWIVLLAAVVTMGVGLLFSFLEYTKPLNAFRLEVQKLAKGEIPQLQSSRFRSVLRQVASDVNDGLDHATAQGGGTRRAADLKQVIGDIPDQPQMSAFSLPTSAAPSSDAAATEPEPSSVHFPPPSRPSGAGGPPPPPRHRASNPDPTMASAVDDDGEPEWYAVFAEFVKTKQSCGEATDGVTFDKFKQTLRKNRDALVQRHGVSKVKFTVYVKEGRAALKASPIKDA